MDNLQIVTDSTADIPKDVVEAHDIKVVPLAIHFGDEQYTDGVDLTSGQFYDKLKSESTMPRTSQPAPGQFAEVYREAIRQGKKILSIHISSKLSGTFQAASLAADMVGKQHVTLIDSLSASMGTGLQVIAAAKNKHSLADAEKAVNAAKENLGLLFLVDSLEYMEKNGRIGRASSLLGSLLQIKPVLSFREGIVDVVEKVRGGRKSYRRVLEIFQEKASNTKVDVAVVHADAEERAKQLLQDVQGLAQCVEVYLSDIGPIVGSHGGPGTLGLIWTPSSI